MNESHEKFNRPSQHQQIYPTKMLVIPNYYISAAKMKISRERGPPKEQVNTHRSLLPVQCSA